MNRFRKLIILVYSGFSILLAQGRPGAGQIIQIGREAGASQAIELRSWNFVTRETSSAIHLIYTGNLNCALDNCHCGGQTVGGLTRIITVLDSLRQKYPDLILVDGGDFLNSYPLPEANQLMLSLLSQAAFSALNLGDQEFVQGTEFILNARSDSSLNLPLLSSNITGRDSGDFPVEQIKVIENSGTAITLLGVVDPGAFEFISAEQLNIMLPAEILKIQQSLIDTSSGIQILLYHGKPAGAEKLAEKFPWLDVLVLSHNQELRFNLKKRTALVESASEGEYIGHLQIRSKNGSWEFENEFIPIYESIPPAEEAKWQVDEYRRKVRESPK